MLITNQHTIVTANSPECLLDLLRTKHMTTSFLIIRRPLPKTWSTSGYYIERVLEHRRVLQARLELRQKAYSVDDWFFHGGLFWPEDLTTLPGPWKAPLDFVFPHLMLVDLDIEDAVYWVIPILQAIGPDAPFRRIILRECDGCDELAIPFPFGAFDRHLDERPAVMVLIGWAVSEKDEFIEKWRSRLPKLESGGRMRVLYSDGPHGM
jgi:hypothetical protein